MNPAHASDRQILVACIPASLSGNYRGATAGFL
jgi:hypothetical protein